jgi:hypothetical protein
LYVGGAAPDGAAEIFRLIFIFLFTKHVMTPVRKVAFSGRNLRDKWLFEARSDDFLGQAFGGASRGLQ